jgi:hypothetical protein
MAKTSKKPVTPTSGDTHREWLADVFKEYTLPEDTIYRVIKDDLFVKLSDLALKFNLAHIKQEPKDHIVQDVAKLLDITEVEAMYVLSNRVQFLLDAQHKVAIYDTTRLAELVEKTHPESLEMNDNAIQSDDAKQNATPTGETNG